MRQTFTSQQSAFFQSSEPGNVNLCTNLLWKVYEFIHSNVHYEDRTESDTSVPLHTERMRPRSFHVSVYLYLSHSLWKQRESGLNKLLYEYTRLPLRSTPTPSPQAVDTRSRRSPTPAVRVAVGGGLVKVMFIPRARRPPPPSSTP